DDADGPRRQAGLEQDFPEHQPSERRLWGGFHDDRVAGGNGWARLVADEVERGVEGRDAGYDAHRLAYDKPHPLLRAGHPVEPHFLSSKAAGFLSTYGQGEDRAVDLLPAVADRLARLPGDRGRELLLALRDEARRLKQDLAAAVGRQARQLRFGFRCGLQGPLHQHSIGHGHLGHHGVIVGVDDGHLAGRRNPLAADEQPWLAGHGTLATLRLARSFMRRMASTRCCKGRRCVMRREGSTRPVVMRRSASRKCRRTLATTPCHVRFLRMTCRMSSSVKRVSPKVTSWPLPAAISKAVCTPAGTPVASRTISMPTPSVISRAMATASSMLFTASTRS